MFRKWQEFPALLTQDSSQASFFCIESQFLFLLDKKPRLG